MANSLMKMKLENIVNCALRASTNSPEERKRVGATIFNYQLDILAVGWNAKPSHSKNFSICVDTATNMSCHDLLHAEIRTIINLGRAGCVGQYMFVTDAPCCRCAGPIAEVGLKHIFYVHDHDDGVGIKLLKEDYGIESTRLKSYTDLVTLITALKDNK